MLVGGMFLDMRQFASLRVPDFKATATADERDLALQVQLFAKVVREKKAALRRLGQPNDDEYAADRDGNGVPRIAHAQP